MRSRRFAIVAALVAAAASPGAAPRPQQAGASRTALAAVTDDRNRMIVDVGPDDVIVQEGGQAREVLDVRVADYPIVLMIDTGADARTDLELMRKAAERFIDRLGPRPIALGTLADPPRLLASFDDDRTVLLERLAALTPELGAKSSMMQGAALAGSTLRAAGSLFSAMIVLSGTASDHSRGDPEQLLAAVVDSGAIVHVIANRATQIAPAPGQVRGGPVLRSIAEQTRGEYTVIYSPASYQAALDKLADRLAGELMVEYLVPHASKAIDVKVGVKLPGAKIRGLGVAPR